MSNDFRKKKKYAVPIAVLGAVSFISASCTPFRSTRENPAASDNIVSDSISTESLFASSQSTEKPSQALSEKTKQAIRKADADIWKALLLMDDEYDAFSTAFYLYIEDGNTEAFNDAILKLSAAADATRDALNIIKYDGIYEYRLRVNLYAKLFLYTGENIRQYLITPDEAYLRNADEQIKKRDSCILSVFAAREKFLSDAGLSDDEIYAIMSARSELSDAQTEPMELHFLPEMTLMPQSASSDYPADADEEDNEN